MLIASFSTNGGQTWTGFINTQFLSTGNVANENLPNLVDPLLNPPATNPAVDFSNADNASVAIDRGENIYITAVAHNAANTEGALVFQRFNFQTGVPVQVTKNTVISRWTNADPILNPVVAVDNNFSSDAGPFTLNSATVIGAGAGYAPGDILNVDGGTFTSPTPAQGHGGLDPGGQRPQQ